ncbi:Hypothetical_protein [Hexamita inflata]|uniref:Hypothetical_protein n=1 Tax=Hexamita inflata TaxID=28002 RepID=A0AA86P7C2_9EUKA|nr:Hypothetical protein HINF_LOCUS20585 [Hexamita inflata]
MASITFAVDTALRILKISGYRNLLNMFTTQSVPVLLFLRSHVSLQTTIKNQQTHSSMPNAHAALPPVTVYSACSSEPLESVTEIFMTIAATSRQILILQSTKNSRRIKIIEFNLKVKKINVSLSGIQLCT